MLKRFFLTFATWYLFNERVCSQPLGDGHSDTHDLKSKAIGNSSGDVSFGPKNNTFLARLDCGVSLGHNTYVPKQYCGGDQPRFDLHNTYVHWNDVPTFVSCKKNELPRDGQVQQYGKESLRAALRNLNCLGNGLYTGTYKSPKLFPKEKKSDDECSA